MVSEATKLGRVGNITVAWLLTEWIISKHLCASGMESVALIYHGEAGPVLLAAIKKHIMKVPTPNVHHP